ncbi:MAG: hypothetical protein HY763_02525 [Planctomycetes bacterium]|nr:hypothetical protein [Planctomycetota bacterium]
MAQEKPNRIVEWVLLMRQHLPVVRQHALDWVAACREEPWRIWHTPAVRYLAYGIGGLVAAWMVVAFVNSFAPPLPASAKPMATTADFHVVCADPGCGHHFLIHRPFGFRRFPVTCPKCDRETGVHARLCGSPQCGGRWVAPAETDGVVVCSQCGAPL